MNYVEEWVEKLKSYETLSALHASDFFRYHQDELYSFLNTPQIHVHEKPVPRLDAFVRAAQWNIEKGKRFDSILDRFEKSDRLKWADILILNESDYGMNRSQNRHVALELADRLGMHMAFGPAHFELTKGTDDDLEIEGENRESIQGNAILSRFPVLKALQIPLPVSFEPYEFEEKRFGRRCCLWVQLQLRQSFLWVGSVHLELRNTPRCRAFQMQHIMDTLPGDNDACYLLGGDLNTNSFGRGSAWRTLQSVARLFFYSPERVKRQLLYPDKGREPLFEVAKQNGFFWDGLNSNEETARAALDTLEESKRLPRPLLRMVKKRLEPFDGHLRFKLDWFLGKGLNALSEGWNRDPDTGLNSLNPGRVEDLNYGPDRISDHLPIYVDLNLR